MPRLNLVNFETVCCIARLGTFSAAAARLNASQSAITARVRELEESLGIVLFQKRGRRMELTIEARKLIEDISPLVMGLEEAVSAYADAGVARGIVRIGLAQYALRWFPEAMRQLKRDMPQVQYEVDVDVSRSVLQKLEAGTLDIGFVPGKLEVAGLITVPLSPGELRWLMSPQVATVDRGRRLPLKEILNGSQIWLQSRTSTVFPHAIAALQAQGANLRNVNTCTSMQAILEITTRTNGIGLVTTASAAPLVKSGQLVEVSPLMAPIAINATLAFHRDQQQSAVRLVVDRLIEFDRSQNGTK